MEMSLGEVAAALGTTCDTPEKIARGYSIDSRTTAEGDLFFAIRGPRFNGHDFVASAFARGAVGAVVVDRFPAPLGAPWEPGLLRVRDTTRALQELAQAVRRRWGRTVIGITGSTGKSTTKEMLAAILARRFRVLKNPGNLNNHYGLPLTLLALEPQHEIAVVELAMSAAGEIRRLAQLAEPQMGLVTNVAPVHLQFFDSLDAIARAKRELIENLRAPGTAVLNHDDKRVRQFAKGFVGHVITYGFTRGADYVARDVRPGSGPETRFRVRGPDLDFEFTVPLPGRHNVQNALAAIAAASSFAVTPAAMQEGLSVTPVLPQRQEVLTLEPGIIVLNDSYNSNPLAMERMLETLGSWRGARRRIVVAGEMLELGPASADLHRAVGRKCAACGVDWLLAVQGDARFFLEGALEMGFPAELTRFFPGPEEAAEFCSTLLQPGDVVLVKGSRGVHLEKVAELLRATHPVQAGGVGEDAPTE
jgi:UDP-N-acetylmuramoyl-tripeptide--D-alanyl-D-alanine ligase